MAENKGKNWLGAAKNGFKLLKSGQLKKKLKAQLIKIILMVFIPILLGAFLLGVYNVVKDGLVNLIANAISIVAGFFEDAWKYITDDYWFDMEAKKEYEIDGEILSLSVIDKYLYELGNQGISLEALRLLGEADYSNPNLLADENNKALVEKYIAEFIRADFITQQAHRRKGEGTVNSSNQYLLDGGIYVYRTTKEPVLDENDFKNGEYIIETVEVTDSSYEPMEYITPEEFASIIGTTTKLNDIVESQNQITVSKSVADDLRYSYTIDDESGKMIMVEINSNENASGATEVDGWFDGIQIWWQEHVVGEKTYKIRLIGIEYKSLISKYSMPYEFLINLCQITQNPEFVYHIALLARDTKIKLVVQDNVTIERYTSEADTKRQKFEGETPNAKDATVVEEEITRRRESGLTITQTPVLNIEYADTWSFLEEFEYTKNFEARLEEKDTDIEVADENIPLYQGTDGKYYGEYTKSIQGKSQNILSITTYNKSVLKNGSTEKSTQFLGLLRNSTGKCICSNCYEQGVNLSTKNPNALQCLVGAQFNKKGINVQYRIPGMTKTEAPLNKLVSGSKMLYQVLQTGANDTKKDKLTNPVQNDYNSIYVGRMQGLVEHLQYLMTFPSGDTLVLPEDIDDGEYIGGEYDLAWPLPSDARVTSKFGYRIHPVHGGYTMHNGIDLSVGTGTEIYSIADGTVAKLERDEDTASGLTVYISHTNGMMSIYMHLSEIKVSEGQEVSKGQLIALSGNTGTSTTGAHLHFGLKLNGGYVNPLQYIRYSP